MTRELTISEMQIETTSLRSHNANLKVQRSLSRQYLPLVFSEYGVESIKKEMEEVI